MKWQIVGNQPKISRNLFVFEKEPPLARVDPGSVLQEEGDSAAAFFEIYAIIDPFHGQVNVSADGLVKSSHLSLSIYECLHDRKDTGERAVIGRPENNIAIERKALPYDCRQHAVMKW
jgi:hypothetical protein